MSLVKVPLFEPEMITLEHTKVLLFAPRVLPVRLTIVPTSEREDITLDTGLENVLGAEAVARIELPSEAIEDDAEVRKLSVPPLVNEL